MTPAQTPTLPGKNRGPGRASRIILFIAAVLGSVAYVVVFFALPEFSALFADFGIPPAGAAQFVIEMRSCYVGVSIVSVGIAYYVLYGRKQDGGTWFLMLGLLGVEFIVLMLTATAVFKPIIALGEPTPRSSPPPARSVR